MIHPIRALLVSSLVVALSAPAAIAGEGPQSYADAKALAAKENKPLLVDFFADW